jgi:hypothetical protein
VGADSGVYDGLMNGDSLLVDDWGLNNTLNWVDFVGLWDWDGTWNSNLIWLGDMLVVDNGSFDWDWDGYGDIIGNFVDLEFRFDTVKFGGDDGVGTDWGVNCIGGYDISWGGSKVYCWSGDCSWACWYWEWGRGKGKYGSGVGGWASNLCVCCSWVGNFSSLSVFVSNLNGLCSYLNLTVSNYSSDGTVLSNSWSCMHSFMYSNWSMGNVCSSKSKSSSKEWCSAKSANKSSMSSNKSVSSEEWSVWSGRAQCQTGRQNQKFSHVISVL